VNRPTGKSRRYQLSAVGVIDKFIEYGAADINKSIIHTGKMNQKTGELLISQNAPVSRSEV
jgi:hypothetical protein